MAWFRKQRHPDLGKFVEPPPVPPSDLDDLIEEGELIAAAGARLAVKNLVIMGSLRDGLNYDEARYVQAAREELAALAREKEGDARRASRDLARVQNRPGRAQHFHDYRRADVPTLQRRQEYDSRLAARLRELASDENFARDLALQARANAWEEIAVSLQAKLERSTVSPDEQDYLVYRGDRLRQLEEDLSRALAERGNQQG
jgi:hypothetical protein